MSGTTRAAWPFSARAGSDAARAEGTRLDALAAQVSPERTVASFFKTRDMLRLASDVLAGETAAREGDVEGAVRSLTRRYRGPGYPLVHRASALVLPGAPGARRGAAAGRTARRAEVVYREDLRRNPDNGWSLFGLAESLRAQGKTAEADRAEAEFRRAWIRADVTLTASRF